MFKGAAAHSVAANKVDETALDVQAGQVHSNLVDDVNPFVANRQLSLDSLGHARRTRERLKLPEGLRRQIGFEPPIEHRLVSDGTQIVRGLMVFHGAHLQEEICEDGIAARIKHNITDASRREQGWRSAARYPVHPSVGGGFIQESGQNSHEIPALRILAFRGKDPQSDKSLDDRRSRRVWSKYSAVRVTLSRKSESRRTHSSRRRVVPRTSGAEGSALRVRFTAEISIWEHVSSNVSRRIV